MRALAVLVTFTALGAAACTVPDKFFTDGGDGVNDARDATGTEIDAGLDETAPETTLTTTPAAFSSVATPSFAFTSDEPGTFVCSVDAASPVACTSPHSVSLADGPHTFSVAAIDTAGNQDETPAEHAWDIDTVTPDTSITSAPPAVDNSAAVSFDFAASEGNVTFECSLDAAAFTACTSPDAYASLATGSHNFRVRATDRAGNVDATPASHTWAIDTSTPDTTIDSGPSGPVSTTSATFSFSSPNAGGGATYECRVLPAAFAACTSPRVYTGLSEGSYVFEVRVRNAALTYDPTPATRSWSVDLTPPTTTITTAPSGAVSSTTANIAFTSNEAGSFQCSLEGGAFATCSSPSVQTLLAQGSHSFAVRAVDVAGNTDATPATASWTVDTVPPNTTIVSGPPAAATSTIASFDLSSTEAGTYQCRVDAAAFTGCSDPNTQSVSEGPHTYEARAIDAAGNVDPTPAAWSWSVDTTAPVVTFVAPTPGQSSTTGPYNTFAWSVSRSATTTCSVNGGAPYACTSPQTLHIKAGNTTFTVTATDGAGNPGAATRTWTIACSAPTADSNTFGLIHMDEGSGQSMTNLGNGVGNALFGTTSQTESVDPTWTAPTAGRFGGGISFNAGQADTVAWSIGAAAAYTTHDHTIELWIRPTSTSTASIFTSADGRVRLSLALSGGSFFPTYAITDASGSTTTLQATTAIPLASWHYIAGTYSTTTMTLWVDGTSYTTNTGAISGSFTFGGLRLGSSAFAYGGEMDEVYLNRIGHTNAQMLLRYCPAP